MDKKTKNILYVAAVVIVIVIIAVLMIKPKEVTEEPTVTEPETTEPTAPAPTEEPEVDASGEIQYGTRGILSDVKCEDGKMSAIITNVQEEEMKVAPNTYDTDVRIIVNGIVSKWFVCDKEVLASGEYTYCESLLGEEMSDRLTNNARNQLAV